MQAVNRKSRFISVLLSMGIAMIAQTYLTNLMPTLISIFDDGSRYSFVFTAYVLASSLVISISGKFADYYGTKICYVWGMAIMMSGMLLCALSTSFVWLIIARLISGLGAGLVIPANYGIINELFNSKEIGKVFAFISIYQIINNGIGAVLGGIVTHQYLWRLGFMILVILSIVSIWLTLHFTLSSTVERSEHLQFNFLEYAILTAGLVMMIIVCNGTLSLAFFLVLIFSVGIVLATVITSPKRINSIFPSQILNNKKVRIVFIQMAVTGAILNIGLAYLPIFLRSYMGLQNIISSTYYIIVIVVMGGAGLWVAKIDRHHQKFINIGWGFILAGAILLFFTPALAILVPLVILAIGIGLITTLLLSYTQSLITGEKASINGFLQLTKNIGGTIGLALMQFK